MICLHFKFVANVSVALSPRSPVGLRRDDYRDAKPPVLESAGRDGSAAHPADGHPHSDACAAAGAAHARPAAHPGALDAFVLQ